MTKDQSSLIYEFGPLIEFVTEHLFRRRGLARRSQGSEEGETQARKITRVKL